MNLWLLTAHSSFVQYEHLGLVGLDVANRFYNAFDLAGHEQDQARYIDQTLDQLWWSRCWLFPWIKLCLWLLNGLCQWQRYKGIITRHSMKWYQHGNMCRCTYPLLALQHCNFEVYHSSRSTLGVVWGISLQVMHTMAYWPKKMLTVSSSWVAASLILLFKCSIIQIFEEQFLETDGVVRVQGDCCCSCCERGEQSLVLTWMIRILM